MLVCHQNDVCKIILVVCILCLVDFLVVGKCFSVLWHYIVMSYVDCGDDGRWSDDGEC